MPVLQLNDPVCLARDERNDLIVPLRLARGIEAIVILVRTVLLLYRDEWFLDRDAGTPWLPTEDGAVTEPDAILGQAYDAGKLVRVLRKEILAVTAVRDVVEFRSSFDGETRAVSISCVVRTAFGDAPVTATVG